MNRDISATLARSLYQSSDKANAPENQSQDWQAGYAYGCALSAKQNSGIDHIRAEYARRGSPDAEGDEWDRFKGWKRGFWAASIQKAVLHCGEDAP